MMCLLVSAVGRRLSLAATPDLQYVALPITLVAMTTKIFRSAIANRAPGAMWAVGAAPWTERRPRMKLGDHFTAFRQVQ